VETDVEFDPVLWRVHLIPQCTVLSNSLTEWRNCGAGTRLTRYQRSELRMRGSCDALPVISSAVASSSVRPASDVLLQR